MARRMLRKCYGFDGMLASGCISEGRKVVPYNTRWKCDKGEFNCWLIAVSLFVISSPSVDQNENKTWNRVTKYLICCKILNKLFPIAYYLIKGIPNYNFYNAKKSP